MIKGKRLLVLFSFVMVLAIFFAGCEAEESGQPEASSGTEETATNETNYPEDSIEILQGFAAGGGSDSLAQVTQPYLEKILGETFVNQYIPGATGAIAWTQLAKQTDADGYTLSITNTPMLMTNYIMNEEITYNIDEFDPIANVVTDPGIIVVGNDSKYNTAEELFEDAMDKPGEITAGNSGVGGDDFFTILMFAKESGIEFQQIPFEGDGPSWQAAMGNKIDASFNNLGITYPQIDAGNLRALAIFAEERNPLLPDVPTVKELGYDVVNGSSRGYSAPKGLPEDVKQKLYDAFKEMSEDPDFIKGCEDRGLPIDIKIADDYEQYLQEQEKIFGEIWEDVKDQYQ